MVAIVLRKFCFILKRGLMSKFNSLSSAVFIVFFFFLIEHLSVSGFSHFFVIYKAPQSGGYSGDLIFYVWVIPCQVIQLNEDFSSDPHQNSDLRLLSSTKLEFLKSDLYFWIYEHLKFWCFSRGLDQKILGVLLLELQLIVIPLSLNIFIQHFAVKWKAPCWTKQHRKFFTGDLSTLVNRCYKATRFSCAFKHDDILNTYNSNSATSIDFIFYVRAGVMEILLYFGHPYLFLNFRQKNCLCNSIYPLKFFFLKIFKKNIIMKLKKLNFFNSICFLITSNWI